MISSTTRTAVAHSTESVYGKHYERAIDLDPNGGVADSEVDQRQEDLMLADRRLSLTGEFGVDQRKLPRGGGLLGDNAVAPAEEAQIVGLVACLVDAGEARIDVEIDVAQIAVLRDAGAHGYRPAIPSPDTKVDVRQR